MNSGVSFGFGVAIGIGIGIGIMHHIDEKEVDERLEEVTAERDAFYKELRDRDIEIGPRVKVEDKVSEKTKDEHESFVSEIDIPDLSKRFGDQDFDEHFGDRDHPHDDAPVAGPLRVSQTEYEQAFDTNGGWSESFTYYQEDGVLTDERDHVVEDPERIAGKVLDELVTTDEDEVFIHDESADAWYEITIDHALAYYKDVAGED